MRREFRFRVSESSARRILFSLVLFIGLAGASVANAQTTFIQMADIRGDSVVKGWEGAIVAHSWVWGMQNPPTLVDGRYASTRANFDKLSFTHNVDHASPALMYHCASGRAISDVRLTQLRQTGSGLTKVLVIDLQDVRVSDVAVSGMGHSDAPPTEQVTLSYATIKVSYIPSGAELGKATGNVEFQWNVAKNAP